MNKKLDELTCLIDGKITVFRMSNNDKYVEHELRDIQLRIQKLYDYNKKSLGKIKKVH